MIPFWLKLELWNRAEKDGLNDPAVWRLDPTRRYICWFAFGDRNNPYGWEAGHKLAKVDGGSDELENLQAEHYKTNLEKESVRKLFARAEAKVLMLGMLPTQGFSGAPVFYESRKNPMLDILLGKPDPLIGA